MVSFNRIHVQFSENERSMKSQNDPTMPERRKLLAAGAGIAAASLLRHVRKSRYAPVIS